MSMKAASLSVKGAKYNQRNGGEKPRRLTDNPLRQFCDLHFFTADESSRERLPERISAGAPANGHFNNFFLSQQRDYSKTSNVNTAPITPSVITPSTSSAAPTTYRSSPNPNPTTHAESKAQVLQKYWKMNEDETSRGEGDVVIIHVCDENQQISKDFCCKRDILVKHMKYFEKFLAENENGYDDIDISVHCDVEIFEWLMTYIHEPDTPPKIEKAIIVSILISSEFLQMESLVELCIQHVASNLSEIIKLPIDLSCISEKLVNRIAFITQPKVRPYHTQA